VFNLGREARVVALKSVGSEVSHQASRLPSQAFGTTPLLVSVANLRLEPRGRYLSDEDILSRRPVAVIGAEVARKLFSLRDPIGASLRIDDQSFRVVGVLRPIGLAGGAGSALVGRDLNKDVHIPLTAAESQFGDIIIRRQTGSMSGENIELSEVYVSLDSTDLVVGVAERVRRIVEVGHPGMRDVQIIVPWELLEAERRQQLVWNIVLIAIAAISLLVGGIGIMNIMLASVTERTREIGIRRALGATRQHIVAQFLVETGTLTMLGGLLGIVLGIGTSVGIGRALPWLLRLPAMREFLSNTTVSVETQITPWSVVLSFFVAAVVGLVFGIYPAVVASRQDPIVALRHD
jgi:putative ABC transport system permease protein